jgi:hypothetical protein
LLHWSQRGLAATLYCDDRLVRHWAQGTEPLPESVAREAGLYARCLTATCVTLTPPCARQERDKAANFPALVALISHDANDINRNWSFLT